MELGNIMFGCSRGMFEFPDREIVNSKEWTILWKLVCYDFHCFVKKELPQNLHGGFTNEIFEINPYYWGDCDCNAKDGERHKENCSLLYHNFIYKPLNFWIDWYKYPFRDSYMSDDFNEKKIKEIFKSAYEESKNKIYELLGK